MGRDGGDLLGGDLARAGGEDEAERVGAQFNGELGVGAVGVGADLDPHGGYSETTGIAAEQLREGGGGIGLTHQGLADQEGVVAGLGEAGDVFGGPDAAFGDADDAGGDAGRELELDLRIDHEGVEVAAVDADHLKGELAVEVEGAVELLGAVYLAEDVELERGGGLGEGEELLVGEGGNDEQDGIGGGGAGFEDLEGVDHEILAQAGDGGRGGGDFEVGEGALEELLVGEHGERGGTAGGERTRQGGGLEGLANESLGGGGLFEFGDNGGPGGGGLLALEGGGKATRGVGLGFALERGVVGGALALLHDEGGLRENLLEMGGERPARGAGGRGGHKAILEESERRLAWRVKRRGLCSRFRLLEAC